MKLAEALIKRSDYQIRLEEIKIRLNSNVLVQEGDIPLERPYELIKDYKKTLEEYEKIVIKINKTNNETLLEEGYTLADALTKRDVLLKERAMYQGIVQDGSLRQDRYSRSEIKYVVTVDIKDMQKELDKISKKYRELDTLIQSKNWMIDLI